MQMITNMFYYYVIYLFIFAATTAPPATGAALGLQVGLASELWPLPGTLTKTPSTLN